MELLRWPLKLCLILAGSLTILLGAHGIYAFASRLEFWFADWGKLFFSIHITFLFEAIAWMSMKGFSSWIIPAAVIFGGCFLLWLASLITIPYNQGIGHILRKLKLW